MRTKHKTELLLPCICGFKPTYYTVGYGRTPYDVFCPKCKKQASFTACEVTGSPDNIIDYWNVHVSALTLDQLAEERKAFTVEKRGAIREDEWETYEYYWEKGHGKRLYAR